MSDEKKPPTFVKPGDDPSLDQLLTTIKHDGDEHDPAYFYDMFGRRQKKEEGDADVGAVVPASKVPPNKTRWWVIAGFAIVAMAAPVLVVLLGRGAKDKPAELGRAPSALPMLGLPAPAPSATPSATPPSHAPSAEPSATAAPAAPSATQGRTTPGSKDDDPYADPLNKPDAGRKPRPLIY